MFEFDLQRFDEDAAEAQSADVPEQQADDEPLPEELNGLPEDIARETFAEWKATQAESQAAEEEQTQPEPQPRPQTEESVPYARFKEKVDEANRLKAQLAEYQRLTQQQQQPPQPQAQQEPARQQVKITPEIAQKINKAIEAEALYMSGLTAKDVEELDFVDNDDPRVMQWTQSKSLARDKVFTAIREAQLNQARQTQQFIAVHQAAAQTYNDLAQKEFATEPNVQAIQNFAANEFFDQLPEAEKAIVATSYGKVERNIATPSEMFVVWSHYNKAKAAFLARANGAKRQTQTKAQRSQQAAQLPRSDQLKGGSDKGGSQLTVSEIEDLLKGDFTKLDEKTQNVLCGLT